MDIDLRGYKGEWVDVTTTIDNVTTSETLHTKDEVLALAEHLTSISSELISYTRSMKESP